MSLKVTREKPRISVGFLTETHGIAVTGTGNPKEPAIRVYSSGSINEGPYIAGESRVKSIDASLVAIHTQKDMSNPTGTFRFELVDERRYTNQEGLTWEKIISPNNLIWIDLQRPGLPAIYTDFNGKLEPKISDSQASQPQRMMVGFVDRISSSVSMQSGKPVRRVVIEGRDGAKLLVNAEIKNALAVSFIREEKDDIAFFKKQFNPGIRKPVAELISEYWNNKLFSTASFGQQVQLGDGLISFSFGPKSQSFHSSQVLKYSMSTPNDLLFAMGMLSELQFDGNYFNFFKNFSGFPFNEMFVDTRFDHENVVGSKNVLTNIIDKAHTQTVAGWERIAGVGVTNEMILHPITGQAVPNIGRSELFPDAYPVYSTMYLRTTPFPWRGDKLVNTIKPRKEIKLAYLYPDNKKGETLLAEPDYDGQAKWRSLVIHRVPKEDVLGYNVNRTDADVFSWFWCYDQFFYFMEEAYKKTDQGGGDFILAQYIINPPIYYEQLVRRYGLRYLELRVPFIDLSQALTSSFRYTRRIADYYCFNYFMKNATLTVKGNPNIHIGDRLLMDSDGMEYYIEGVSQDWQVFGPCTTTLTLTRGMPYGFWSSDRFLAFDESADTQINDMEDKFAQFKELYSTNLPEIVKENQ